MPSPRIISFLPSATEIVHALGLGSDQVGRSHECDFPESVKELPICTRAEFPVTGSSLEIDRLVKERLASAVSLYTLNLPAVRALQPTHILTQTLCDVCAVNFVDVQAAFNQEHGLKAEIVSQQAASLDGLWLDIRRVGEALGVCRTAEQLIGSLRARMADLAQRAASSNLRPRVAAIEWIEPLMAAGNWVPELMQGVAAENLFGVAGHHSPWMKWDELRQAEPDVIVALPCGFDLAKTRLEMRALTELPGWNDLRAVRAGEVYLCDGNQFMNRPGPRLVESMQIFAEILHPDLFPPQLQGTGWERY